MAPLGHRIGAVTTACMAGGALLQCLIVGPLRAVGMPRGDGLPRAMECRLAEELPDKVARTERCAPPQQKEEATVPTEAHGPPAQTCEVLLCAHTGTPRLHRALHARAPRRNTTSAPEWETPGLC